MYNLTELQNSSYVVDIIRYANSTTGNVMGDLLLVSIFFIMFFSFKLNYSFEDTLTTSSFMTFVIGLFLYLAGITSLYLIIIFGVAMLGCLIYILIKP